MVPPARTPLRPDRLRALNLPSSVEVGIDTWGQPTWVRESDAEERGRGAEMGQRGSGAEIRDRASADRGVETAGGERSGGGGPPGPGGEEAGDRRVAGSGEAGPPGDGAGRRVEEVIETWIVQDEWWRNPIHRRYVEVVLEGGAHVVLFENLVTGEWFMQKP